MWGATLSFVSSAISGATSVVLVLKVLRLCRILDVQLASTRQPPCPISSEAVEMNDGTIQEVEKFRYFGDVLGRECSAVLVVKARISAA